MAVVTLVILSVSILRPPQPTLEPLIHAQNLYFSVAGLMSPSNTEPRRIPHAKGTASVRRTAPTG